jgi:hypothetical protein
MSREVADLGDCDRALRTVRIVVGEALSVAWICVGHTAAEVSAARVSHLVKLKGLCPPLCPVGDASIGAVQAGHQANGAAMDTSAGGETVRDQHPERGTSAIEAILHPHAAPEESREPFNQGETDATA